MVLGEPITPDRSLRARVTWLVLALLASLAASFVLWDPLDLDERAHVRRMTLHSAAGVRTHLAAEMHSSLLAQVVLAKRWAEMESSSRREWELNSRLFLDQHPSHQVVQWADPTYQVRWAVARDGRHHEREPEVITDERLRRVLQTALNRASGDAVLSPTFPLPDGRAAAMVVVPVFRGEAPAGFLITVLDLKAELDTMLGGYHDLGYAVSVLEGSNEVYRSSGASRDLETTWAQNADLQLAGIAWRIHVWPNADLLADTRSPLPELALVLGGLFGFLLMLSVHLARAARHRSRLLGQAHHEIELRVRERTSELQRSNERLHLEIGERERAEDALQNLSGRQLMLQDEERRRIARELHDSTAQMLGAIAINVDKAQRLAQSLEDPRLSGVLRESATFLEQVTVEIRTVSFLLYPPMLDELGLEYVLLWYATGFSKRSGIALGLNIQPDFGRLPDEIELTLFRIAQEALTNVHRHSGSRTACIALLRDSASVTLEITDRGCGIPQDVLETTRGRITKLGVGIVGMRERVRQLDGRLEITGGHQGTTIRAVLQLTRLGAAGRGIGAGTGHTVAGSPAP